MKREIVTSARMKRLDRLAILHFKIPALLLMENAGRSVAESAARWLIGSGKQIVIFAGKGNNGGDGLAAGRHLANRRFRVKIWIIGNPAEYGSDSKQNYEIVRRMKIPMVRLTRTNLRQTARDVRAADLLIDALFGVGLTRPIQEPYASVIRLLNDSKKRVLSVDLPSGLHADTGAVMGACVKAGRTVTLGFAKRGLYFNQGPRYAGKVEVADISIPSNLITR